MNTGSVIKRVILDLLLAAVSVALGAVVAFILFYALGFDPLPPPAIRLLLVGIPLFLCNLLAWLAWKSWKMWSFGFSLLILSGLLLCAACAWLPNTCVIKNTFSFAVEIASVLVFLYGCAFWSGSKQPMLKLLLLVEFTLCGLAVAVVPLYTVCTGTEVVLETFPVDWDFQIPYQDGLLSSCFEIQFPTLSKSYRYGDSVYVLLHRGKKCWTVKSISKNNPKPSAHNETVLRAEIACNGAEAGDDRFLSFDSYLPRLPRDPDLVPHIKGQARRYFVTLSVSNIGRAIVRSVKLG